MLYTVVYNIQIDTLQVRSQNYVNYSMQTTLFIRYLLMYTFDTPIWWISITSAQPTRNYINKDVTNNYHICMIMQNCSVTYNIDQCSRTQRASWMHFFLHNIDEVHQVNIWSMSINRNTHYIHISVILYTLTCMIVVLAVSWQPNCL